MYHHYTKGGERNEFIKTSIWLAFLNLSYAIVESLSQEESLVREVQFLLDSVHDLEMQ